MGSPLVSIIIPTYNSQDWIANTLNSALAQTPVSPSMVPAHHVQPSPRWSWQVSQVVKSPQAKAGWSLHADPLHPSSQRQAHVSVQIPCPLQSLRLAQSQANPETHLPVAQSQLRPSVQSRSSLQLVRHLPFRQTRWWGHVVSAVHLPLVAARR